VTHRSPLGRALAAVPALVLAFATSPAAAEKAATRGLRFPSLSPDGTTVVFAYRGDVWRAPAAGGGAAVRLTVHEAQDTRPRVSPDGTQVAFTSKRTGNYDVFTMPLGGGEPRQVTFHSGMDVLCDWSPDGKRLLVLSNREPTGRDPRPDGADLYEVDLAGGTPRRVTRDGAREGAYAKDGTRVVYARGFQTPYQDDYLGSANHDLYVVDLAGATTPRRLTRTRGNDWSPAFSADGNDVYFLAEKDGWLNFFAVPVAGGEPRALTSWTDDNARRPSLAADHRTAVFEKDGRLHRVDLGAEKPEAVAIPVTVESDVRNSGTDVRTITSGGEHGQVSPDGDRYAFALRGDVWVLPAAGGEGERLTSGPADDDWPRWSPDGRRIAYSSGAKGRRAIFVIDVATKETRQVTPGAHTDDFHAWTPDGKRLVFARVLANATDGNKDLWDVALDSGEERRLTKDPAPDDDPTVSPDGRWIAFDSGRGGTQAIYVMPSGPGGEAQARRVTTGSAYYQVPCFSPDGTMIAFEEFDQTGDSSGGLFVVRATGGPAMQLSRDGSGPSWSGRGDWIYFGAKRGGETGTYRLRAPTAVEAGERVPFLGRVEVDRRREFGDLFDEAWQKLKDGFYDPKMHGVDWEAMKRKYRPLAVDAEIKDEFHNVVHQMLGELNASHLGIYGGGDDGPSSGGGAGTGHLGLELEAAPAEGGGRRVASIEPKGPADEAGLRVGDVVKTIHGATVAAGTNLDQVLAGAANRDVAVAFAKGDGSGEKTATLKALGAGGLANLKYQRWVESSKKAVEKATRGTAAYLHLTDMDGPNLARFNAALAEMNKAGKKGLVLDVRFNGGGNVHPQLLDALANKPFIQFRPRTEGATGDLRKQVQPALYWGKPVVLLINERSFSDAEVFPYAFKELKLGTVVGVPTAGGVIGTNDVTLSDGSRFRIPRVGWFGLNGENLERLGVKPDVHVEETVEDRLAGRDPQLERAIEILASQLPAPPAGPAPEPKPEAPPLTPEEPAPKPPENPTGTQGPASSAGAAGAANPVFDAKVGEWLKARRRQQGRELTVVLRVKEVTDAEVVLESAVEGGEASEVRETRSRDLSLRGERQAPDARETLTVNGVALHCTVVTVSTRRGTEKRWITNDVPVTGVVRREVNGAVVFEVLEWGTARP
jgi:tricorn protease